MDCAEFEKFMTQAIESVKQTNCPTPFRLRTIRLKHQLLFNAIGIFAGRMSDAQMQTYSNMQKTYAAVNNIPMFGNYLMLHDT
jgi:hypothetical protein|tara:strand:+ start:303 stop:551 length:249 start_codon:yes stop_codon:yes gene_type:complete